MFNLSMKVFSWDIVTVPVDPNNPDESSSFGISELYAINAQTNQQRAAWELLKYLNSDNFYQTFKTLANDEIQLIIDDKKTLDDAIKAIQEKGQQALDKAKTEADAMKVPEKK